MSSTTAPQVAIEDLAPATVLVNGVTYRRDTSFEAIVADLDHWVAMMSDTDDRRSWPRARQEQARRDVITAITSMCHDSSAVRQHRDAIVTLLSGVTDRDLSRFGHLAWGIASLPDERTWRMILDRARTLRHRNNLLAAAAALPAWAAKVEAGDQEAIDHLVDTLAGLGDRKAVIEHFPTIVDVLTILPKKAGGTMLIAYRDDVDPWVMAVKMANHLRAQD